MAIGNWAAGGLAAAAAMTGAAHAGAVDAVHVGVMAHNIQVIDGKNAGKEDGPNVSAEVAFAPIGALGVIGAPRPTVMASVNVAGETSFAGVGLAWRWRFAPGWALEPGLGYVVHDGEVDNPFRTGTVEAEQFGKDNLLLGSRDLFRTTLGLSRDVGRSLSVQLFYEHLSHGQILGSGKNQGLDEAGVRIGWRFGE